MMSPEVPLTHRLVAYMSVLVAVCCTHAGRTSNITDSVAIQNEVRQFDRRWRLPSLEVLYHNSTTVPWYRTLSHKLMTVYYTPNLNHP